MPFILLELANYLEKDTLSPTCFNQEASSSADPQGHGGECDRQTVPHLHLHSPPSGTRASGPDLQHISCQQSLNVLEDFHHHHLLQKSGIYASWVSPESVLVLEGKCHEKQDTREKKKNNRSFSISPARLKHSLSSSLNGRHQTVAKETDVYIMYMASQSFARNLVLGWSLSRDVILSGHTHYERVRGPITTEEYGLDWVIKDSHSETVTLHLCLNSSHRPVHLNA